MREQTIELIKRHKVISIVRGIPLDSMRKLAEALMRGGINLIEVTFAQDAPESWQDTCESIKLLNTMGICAGAGTVITLEQLEMAKNAGARYIISPNADEDIIRATRSMNLVSIPGALTPTEIVHAYNWGADFVKVFPVSTLGSAYIKAVSAPLKHIPLLAVGGITADNMGEFLKAGCKGVGVGGNLANAKLIAQGRFDLIEQCAASYAAQVNT